MLRESTGCLIGLIMPKSTTMSPDFVLHRRLTYSITPEQLTRPEYDKRRQEYLDTAQGHARQALGDLLQYPTPQKLVLPDMNLAQLAHASKTRPDLSTLHDVVHTYCIPDLSPVQLQKCVIESQVASIMRQHVDAELIQAIKECWMRAKEWMQNNGTRIATVHPDGGDGILLDLGGPIDFDPAVDARKPLGWVPPEQSAAKNHWQASVLVRRIASVFFKSFVQEWKRGAGSSEGYKRLQDWVPIVFLLKGKGKAFASPEAMIRSGASTMVEQSANSMDTLCELMSRAHSVDVLDAKEPRYRSSAREHSGYLAEVASFGIAPFTRFGKIVHAGPQKPNTMPKDYLPFLEQFGLTVPKEVTLNEDWGNVYSSDCPLIDQYFQLREPDPNTSTLDIQLNSLTPEELTNMLSTNLYTKCHARGQVMKEMLQWFMEIYTKWVLPMFKFESRRT